MIKQAEDLKPGDKLYVIHQDYALSILTVKETKEMGENSLVIVFGWDEEAVVDKDCTSFSYNYEAEVFLNKKHAIIWLEEAIKVIQETIKDVEKEDC